MRTAEIVIIGGGIVGSSIAYHLTAAGGNGVLVMERESAQGKGSTGKSMGGVRAQFSTAVNIQMALYSIPFYASFDERLGHPCGYRAQGYLFCATSDQQMQYLRRNHETQKRLGLKDARLLGTDEIRSLYPQLRSDDIVGGSFCSSDGFIDPYSAMTGFMSWACDHGAELWKNCEVTGIELDSTGVSAVHSSRGTVATRTVVNCAGAWAAAIAKMVNVDLPVEPLRRMLVPTEPFDRFPHSAPMILTCRMDFTFAPRVADFCWRGTIPRRRPGTKPISIPHSWRKF
jgi:sarcosine oxidase, subunit beta